MSDSPPLYRATLPNGAVVVGTYWTLNGMIQRALWEAGLLANGDRVSLTDFRGRVGGPDMELLLGWRYVVNEGEVDIAVELDGASGARMAGREGGGC